jgi:hypothetical protein
MPSGVRTYCAVGRLTDFRRSVRVHFLVRTDRPGHAQEAGPCRSPEPGLEVTAGTALLAALSTTPVAVGAVGARGTVHATLAGKPRFA